MPKVFVIYYRCLSEICSQKLNYELCLHCFGTSPRFFPPHHLKGGKKVILGLRIYSFFVCVCVRAYFEPLYNISINYSISIFEKRLPDSSCREAKRCQESVTLC